MDQKLDQARLHAAQLSGGTSKNAVYEAIVRVLIDLDLHGTALDFGAGTGSLTRQLSASGRFESIAAADLLERPPDLDAVQWVHADLNEQVPIPSETFDVVIAAEVIEHLENPRSVMRELFRLLVPGGTAIVTTPNNESWRALLSLVVRGHYVEFCDGSYPAHITALLRRDLERIAKEAGFESVEVRFTGHGGIPGWPAITWQRISAGALKGLRFSDNLIAICRKPQRSR